jgi:hypothetical protein
MVAQLDPNWAQFGASSADEYAWWVSRACGIVCVKMVVEALGGPQLSVMDWVRRGLDLKGYLVKTNLFGEPVEKGWIHQALAELCIAEGLPAQICEARAEDFPGWVAQGKMGIISVSYEIGTDLAITHRGGHLVVVTGYEMEDGEISAVLVNNPSGRTEKLRVNACIPIKRFGQAFKGRVIIISGGRG